MILIAGVTKELSAIICEQLYSEDNVSVHGQQEVKMSAQVQQEVINEIILRLAADRNVQRQIMKHHSCHIL